MVDNIAPILLLIIMSNNSVDYKLVRDWFVDNHSGIPSCVFFLYLAYLPTLRIQGFSILNEAMMGVLEEFLCTVHHLNIS